MNQVVVPNEHRPAFAGRSQPTRVFDSDGNFLGTFFPQLSDQPYDEAVWEMMLQHMVNPQGRTYEEIWHAYRKQIVEK
jgi:hypothetical protein